MLVLTGLVGFAAAIGAHPAVGYIDLVHLAPAVVGAMLYLAGLTLTYGQMMRGRPGKSEEVLPRQSRATPTPALVDQGGDLTRITAFQRCVI